MKKYDSEKKTFSTTPEHDENSHPADAWRTVALTYEISEDNQVIYDENDPFNGGTVNVATFGEMKQEYLRKKRLQRAERY